MPIICGTDFSERGRAAAEVAALLAARAGTGLELVHALDVRGAVFGAAEVLQAIQTAARQRLELEAQELRALGAQVDVSMPDGWADDALIGQAERSNALLIVLSATGSRDGAGVQVGKTCERALARTTVPMLVVRDAPPLASWLRGERPLAVLVAFDFSQQSVAALRLAARIARAGACRIVVAYVGDPEREAGRMGLTGALDEAQERLRQAIANRVASLEPALAFDVVVSPHLGDAAARLIHLAEREKVDLIVTGTSQRGALARVFTGSVSLQLLREAGTNLVVVPGTAPSAAEAPREFPPVRRVLVATDLSEHGNHAVAYALAFTPAEAELTVIHVMSPNQMLDGVYGRRSNPAFDAEHAEVRAGREQALQALVQPLAERAGRKLRCEVVEHEQAARAITEQARQHDAQLVCLGTLGRSGLSAVLLGSTAQEVLKQCRRPLLLVPPDERT